jgi:hypothetical protein
MQGVHSTGSKIYQMNTTSEIEHATIGNKPVLTIMLSDMLLQDEYTVLTRLLREE